MDSHVVLAFGAKPLLVAALAVVPDGMLCGADESAAVIVEEGEECRMTLLTHFWTAWTKQRTSGSPRTRPSMMAS